MPMGIFEEFLL